MEDKLLAKLDSLNKKRLDIIKKIKEENLDDTYSLLKTKSLIDTYLEYQIKIDTYIDIISEQQ